MKDLMQAFQRFGVRMQSAVVSAVSSVTFCVILCLSLSFVATSTVRAQGSLADYERANSLADLTRGKVSHDHVRPHWLKGNRQFWYRNEWGDGRHQFILVDASSGLRKEAFDHDRLAVIIAETKDNLEGEETDPERLPFRTIEFAEDGALLFTIAGQGWRCDLTDYRLEETDPIASDCETTVRVLGRERSGFRTGEETSIRFVNRTEGRVSIHWFGGSTRQFYAKIEPGRHHDQHTFDGHVWLATDDEGKTVGIYEATESPGIAVMDGTWHPRDRRRQADIEKRRRGVESPNGMWRVKIVDHNVILVATTSGEESQLTTDGIASDAYQNHVFWSPDSKKFMVIREEEGDHREVHFVESTPSDQRQPKLHTHEYAKPGDRLPRPRPCLFYINSNHSHPVPVATDLFDNPWSLGEYRWDEDSQRFTFLYNERGHQRLRLVAVDANSGKASAIIDEESETFLCYSSKLFLHHVAGSKEIVWMSERDGWCHLYLYDSTSGQVANQITKGQWVVRGVDRVDDDRRQIWFRASGIHAEQDPYYVHYCRVDFDGSNLIVLTEGNGSHTIEYSPDGEYFLDRYSRVDAPPTTELRCSEDGTLVCELERADGAALLATGWQAPERFSAKGRDSETDIYGVIYRPTNFDPKESYPVIEAIYAGPHSAHVPKRFASYHSAQSMAELGFIVVQIDGMGTSHRSKAFHDVCWQNLGDAGLPDRVLWIQAAAASRSWMDTTRVGIYGGSAGGQNAMRALISHGDFYSAAAADCGCHDNRMDKIWWNEQWMGWPVGPHYAEASNVDQAHRLQGHLLLTVGELDRNVDPSSTMQVVDALIKADKDFELIVFPGSGHGAGGSTYGKRRRRDFFVRHLLNARPRHGKSYPRETER